MVLPGDARTLDTDGSELDLRGWQSKALSVILIVVAVTGLPAYATVVINAIRDGQMTLQVWLYLAIYVASVGLAVFPRLDSRLRSIGLFALTYTNAAASFARLGLVGSGRLWLVVMPIIATIVVGSWAGYATLVLSLLIYTVFSVLAHSGMLANWVTLLTNPLTVDYWIEGGTALVIFLVATVILVDRFHTLQTRTLAASRQAATDLEQSARSLRESQERYQTLVSTSPDGILQIDLEGRILYASPQLVRMAGATDPSEIVDTSVLEWIAPKDRERAQDNIRRALQGLAIANTPYTFARSNGEQFPVEVNSAPWRDAAGQTGGIISIVRDVTKRIQTEIALRDKTLELERFFDCALDLLCIADTDGHFERLNREWESVLGYPLEELEGGNFLDWVHTDDLDSTLEAMSDLDEQQEVLNFVNRYRRQDGSYRWIEWRSFPFDKKIYAAARDITERKRAEEEIRRLNEELEQRVVERTAQLEAATKEMEAFSYSVSHDLRAPLRAVDGYTRILVEDYEPLLDTEGQRVCGVIRQQTQRMGQLIDDLLAFSRLGRADIRPVGIDMEKLVLGLFDELTTPADRARIDFDVGPLPPAVGDARLIRQVWLNLLSNALKFSANQERAVIQVSGTKEDKETVYSVHDNGAGFDMAYADKLFGVFQRLHSEREFEGTGVGLAIVQRVIHRHGGRVWAKSEPGEGATFCFALPQKETPARPTVG